MSISFALMEITEDLLFNPILLDSRLLKRDERNYGILNKEVLSTVFALQSCDHYIRQSDHDVILFSDCSAIQFLKSNKNHSSKLFQNSLYLSSFNNLTICHIAGKFNAIADLLSRQVFDAIVEDKTEPSDILSNIVIPAKTLIKDGAILNSSDLNKYIMSSTPHKYVSILPSRRTYSIKKDYLKLRSVSCLPPESKFLFSLQKLASHNLRNLNSNIIRDYLLTLKSERLPKHIIGNFLDAMKAKLSASQIAAIYPLEVNKTESYLNRLQKNCPNLFDKNCGTLQDPIEKKYNNQIYLKDGLWHKKLPLNTARSEVQVATLNVSRSSNIFADSDFFITNNCEQCK